MDPGWAIWKDFWLEISIGPRLGGLVGVLAENCDGEVLGRSYVVLVGRLGKGCCSVHQTGPGSVNVCVGCFGGLAGRQGAKRFQN